MKITISQKTKIIIEIDFPDQSDETVSKTTPKKPFSFFDKILREVERNIQPEILEDKFNGSFLTQ
jgi:hypothetical protein